MSEEGKLAFMLVSRVLIELTVNEYIPKQASLEMLEDIQGDLRAQSLGKALLLARSLAIEIEAGMRDDPG